MTRTGDAPFPPGNGFDKEGPLATGREQGLVMVFVKSPTPGRVKTRLAGRLGAPVAAELYKRFVADVLHTLSGGPWPVRIFFYPAEEEDRVRAWLGPERRCAPQRGDGLGPRMKNAFIDTFADGYSRAVLIGTDFPDLPLSILDRALSMLGDAGAVLGPANDGGYYLIGFTRSGFFPEIFHDAPWGTPAVFRQAFGRFAAAGRPVRLLPVWRDIDTPEDLADFATAPKAPGDAARTRAYLAEIGYHP